MDAHVIVTGAGNGLGRSYAKALAARGAKVVVNDIGGAIDGAGEDPSVAERVVAEITAAGGVAVADHSSVATAEGGDAIVATAVDAFGSVDAVVCNAGIIRHIPFVELTEEDFDAVVRVHLYGAFHVSQPAFRAMQRSGGGSILLVSSSAGLFGNSGNANYSAAKAGVFGLMRALAMEGAPHGIRANALLPVAPSRMSAGMTEAQMRDIAAQTPADLAGPAPSLETVTAMVVHLVDASCPITGEAFSVVGNRFARVFVGVADGWRSPLDVATTPDDVAAHIEEIRDIRTHAVPTSMADEFTLARR